MFSHSRIYSCGVCRSYQSRCIATLFFKTFFLPALSGAQALSWTCTLFVPVSVIWPSCMLNSQVISPDIFHLKRSRHNRRSIKDILLGRNCLLSSAHLLWVALVPGGTRQEKWNLDSVNKHFNQAIDWMCETHTICRRQMSFNFLFWW